MAPLPSWPPALEDEQQQELSSLAATWALSHVMGNDGGVSDVDPFTRDLWNAWKAVRDIPDQQPLHLGLFRSDYMLHQYDGGNLDIKQVEFNTISSSFGPLSHQVSALHRTDRYLAVSTGYFGVSPHLDPSNFPENSTRSGLVEGLVAAHTAYNNPSARILFVVQPNERNMFDQRWLEYEILDKYGIHVIRHTLETLSLCATLDKDSSLLVKASQNWSSQPSEISVVYFRATYTPNDFKSSTDWDTRILLEKSRAIKCPSLPLQLAGGKMIQAVLAAPGVLERFIGRTEEEKEWIPEIRNSWMEMWPLASSSETSDFISSLKTVAISNTVNPLPSAGHSGITRASELYSQLVLKPQREGGGNNVYHDSIPPFLKSLEANLEEARAWIAMRLIQPPKSGSENYLVGAGTSKALKKDTVSELGIFGWSLFGGPGTIVDEKTVGWLVRTKGRESDEGGVAVGYSPGPYTFRKVHLNRLVKYRAGGMQPSFGSDEPSDARRGRKRGSFTQKQFTFRGMRGTNPTMDSQSNSPRTAPTTAVAYPGCDNPYTSPSESLSYSIYAWHEQDGHCYRTPAAVEAPSRRDASEAHLHDILPIPESFDFIDIPEGLPSSPQSITHDYWALRTRHPDRPSPHISTYMPDELIQDRDEHLTPIDSYRIPESYDFTDLDLPSTTILHESSEYEAYYCESPISLLTYRSSRGRSRAESRFFPKFTMRQQQKQQDKQEPKNSPTTIMDKMEDSDRLYRRRSGPTPPVSATATISVDGTLDSPY
ncbi:glutathione synthase, ATP-binding domain protein [Rhizoctonia solani]|uniref:glutathione synthase n=1 Tax=Rhizoctonia solani TaxID=456999 RepID=A0A8H8NWC0_9AGAM|nr:glutathione synthase, ATP-binding domain protein [Rhizoctonia solani]QRW19927.1 glutathione synthase, ATP-binding domain protein [Rhizoctonia solani]